MMRRLVTVCAMLLPAASLAGWKVVSVPGIPYDVQVADAGWTDAGDGGTPVTGLFAVATSQGAFELEIAPSGSDVVQQIDGGSSGAYVDPAGCLWSFRSDAGATDLLGVGCASQATFGGLFAGETVLRFRSTVSGVGHLLTEIPTGSPKVYLRQAPLSQLPSTPSTFTGFLSSQGALDALTVDAGELALFGGRSSTGSGYEIVAEDGGLTSVPLTAQPSDVELLDAASALLVMGGGLAPLPLGGGSSSFVVPTDAGISAVAFSEGTDDDDGGIGFGMAAGVASGASQGPRIFVAVPMPGAPAQRWIPSAVATGASGGSVVQLDCRGAALCVGVTDAGTGNVLVYRNENAPVSGLPSHVDWTDGGSTLTLPFAPFDADGDAVTVLGWSWDGGFGVSLPDGGGGGAGVLTLTAPDGGICPPPATETLQVRLTDGWRVHDRVLPTRVDRPGAPLAVSPPSGELTAICGQGAVGRVDDLLPAGSCPGASVGLDAGTVANLSVGIDGTGGSFTVRVVPSSDGGLMEMGALLGKSIPLSASASAGTQVRTSPVVSLRIDHADPFLTIDREIEAPSVPGSGTLGVRATVRMAPEAGCQIHGASLEEHLFRNGFTYVPGSARVNGAPANAKVRDGTLVIRDLFVAPDHPEVVTYDVRAQVWGSPRLKGAVWFPAEEIDGGIRISEVTPLVRPAQTAGCACRGASGEGGCTLLLLMVLGIAITRGRKGATDDPPVR